jgi:hypothetical protein
MAYIKFDMIAFVLVAAGAAFKMKLDSDNDSGPTATADPVVVEGVPVVKKAAKKSPAPKKQKSLSPAPAKSRSPSPAPPPAARGSQERAQEDTGQDLRGDDGRPEPWLIHASRSASHGTITTHGGQPISP